MVAEKLIIDGHYNGPPDSGNGGYTCGLIDAQTDFVSEVTLRKPIPLDKLLTIEQGSDLYTVKDGDTVIATAKPGDCSEMDVPASVGFHRATKASRAYLGFHQRTAFPTCFVCGEDRPQGEGLHIFAGPVKGTGLYASPWIPAPTLGDEFGAVLPQFIWAALDCPGAYAALGNTAKPILLGRMTAELMLPISAGEKCVIMAWLIDREGRKSWSGTAIFNEQGELVGKAKAIWFEV